MSANADAVVPGSASNASPRHQSLQDAKRNVAYLLDPTKSPAPGRLRTRALLKTFRYIGVFIFWRLVRYIKYAAIGALTAAVAGTAIGSVASGAAFIIAPTGIFAGAGVGLIWGLGKFGWRTLARRVRHGDVEHANARTDESNEERGKRSEPEIRPPRTDPW